MIENRIKWQNGTYAASNAELYAILGNCLELFNKAKDAKTGLAKAITEQLEERGIGYNSSTSLALKIIRLVFVGPNMEQTIASRAFSYARVLKVASDAGQTGDTLETFITDNHGIDELRRANKEGLSEADKAKQNKDYAETVLSDANGIMQIEMRDELQPADGEQFSLALIRKNTDGTGTIVFGTDKLVPIKTVLTMAGSQLKEQASQTEQAGVAKRNEEQRKANLISLSQEMEPQSFQPAFHVDVTKLNGAAIPAE
jgi:choline dehydrogenase-like flavoprotein